MKTKHKIKKITVIIEKYDNDPKRVGDEITFTIMSNGKKITIYELYQEMIKRFDKQDAFNAWVVNEFKAVRSEIAKTKKDNKLK